MIYFTHLVRLSLSCKWVDKKPVMRVLLVIAKSIAIWYGYIIALSRMIGYFWIIKLSTNKPRPLPFARGTKATFSCGHSPYVCKVTGQKIPQMNKH